MQLFLVGFPSFLKSDYSSLQFPADLVTFTGEILDRKRLFCAVTLPSVHLQKTLFQEASQYLDFFMLLPDVISVMAMTSLSKIKQYIEGVNLNPGYALGVSLRGKCPYSELFWFTYSSIWTECGLNVFSPNAGKCGPE